RTQKGPGRRTPGLRDRRPGPRLGECGRPYSVCGEGVVTSPVARPARRYVVFHFQRVGIVVLPEPRAVHHKLVGVGVIVCPLGSHVAAKAAPMLRGWASQFPDLPMRPTVASGGTGVDAYPRPRAQLVRPLLDKLAALAPAPPHDPAMATALHNPLALGKDRE